MSTSRILLVIATLSMPAVVLASFPRAGTKPGVQRATSDSRIKARVKTALRADRKLRGSAIVVQSADDGVVVLAGRARTVNEHLRATGDAARVPGVHRVTNAVEIQDLLTDEESPGDRDHGTADSVHDPRSTSATGARVLADSPTPGLRLVDVDTRNGAVTLFGRVPAARVEAAAEENARKLRGVKRLVNGGYRSATEVSR